MRMFTEEPQEEPSTLTGKIRSALSALFTKNKAEYSSRYRDFTHSLQPNFLNVQSMPFSPISVQKLSQNARQQDNRPSELDEQLIGQHEGENVRDYHNIVKRIARQCMDQVSKSMQLRQDKQQTGEVIVDLKQINRVANESTIQDQTHACQFKQYHSSLEYIKYSSYLSINPNSHNLNKTPPLSLYKCYGRTTMISEYQQSVSREDLEYVRMMKNRKDMLRKRYHQIIDKQREQDRQSEINKLQQREIKNNNRMTNMEHKSEQRSRSRDNHTGNIGNQIKRKANTLRIYDMPQTIQMTNKKQRQKEDQQKDELILTKCKADAQGQQSKYKYNQSDQQQTRKKNVIKKLNTFQQQQKTEQHSIFNRQTENECNVIYTSNQNDKKQKILQNRQSIIHNKLHIEEVHNGQSNNNQIEKIDNVKQNKVNDKSSKQNPFIDPCFTNSQPTHAQQQKIQNNPFLAKNLKNLDLKSIIFGSNQTSKTQQMQIKSSNQKSSELSPNKQSSSSNQLLMSLQSPQTPTFNFSGNPKINEKKNYSAAQPTQRICNSFNTGLSNFMNGNHQPSNNTSTNISSNKSFVNVPNYLSTSNNIPSYFSAANVASISSNFTSFNSHSRPDSASASTVTFAPSLPSSGSMPKYNQLATDMLSKNNFDEYNKKAAAVFFAHPSDQQSLFGDTDRTARKNKSHSTGKKMRGGPARIS